MGARDVDPGSLVGKRLVGVTVGWHVNGDNRHPVLWGVEVESGFLRISATGAGGLTFSDGVAPRNFEMQEFGRYEFAEAVLDDIDGTGPLAPLFGRVIAAVDSIRWRGAEVGIRLRSGDAVALLINLCDEIIATAGDLPVDYEDADITPRA